MNMNIHANKCTITCLFFYQTARKQPSEREREVGKREMGWGWGGEGKRGGGAGVKKRVCKKCL